jgi:hypothetical protein
VSLPPFISPTNNEINTVLKSRQNGSKFTSTYLTLIVFFNWQNTVTNIIAIDSYSNARNSFYGLGLRKRLEILVFFYFLSESGVGPPSSTVPQPSTHPSVFEG